MLKGQTCQGGFQYFTPVQLETYANIVKDQIPMDERLGFKVMPLKEVDATRIVTRRPDYIRGLQQFRDRHTASPKLNDYFNRFGSFCSLESDEWSEFDDIHAYEIAESVAPTGCATDVVDISELMAIRMTQLITRETNLQEFNIWSSIFYGKYIAEKAGQIVQEHDYPVRYLAPLVAWSDYANAKPLADLRAVSLLFRGLKLVVDKTSWFILNLTGLHCLMANINPQDLGKSVVSACCELLTQNVIDARFASFNLPSPTVYNEGYWTRGQFHPFVPDGFAAVIARHTEGQPIGFYCLTRHGQACSGNKTGVGGWTKIDDNCERSAGETRRIRIEKGHAGVVQMIYPEAVIIIPTGC